MRSPKTKNTPVRVWLWFTPTQAVLAAFVACAEVFSVWGIEWHLVNTGGWGLLSNDTRSHVQGGLGDSCPANPPPVFCASVFGLLVLLESSSTGSNLSFV